ncbi:MAG: hypothetical protein OK454_07235, partial [Thaumarchaeota archaeon]|nr:hypothetical protein [Nitrososphaerota archaeon]
MPSAAARRLYEDQIPSFMSVFDLDPATLEDRGTITVVDANMITMDPSSEPKRPTRPNQQQHLRPDSLAASDPSHKHNDSTSTQNSESPESSPTTTVSCT